MYDALIGAVRAEIPAPAELIYAKVTDVSTSAERQKLTLSNGETISARLVVLANGLSVGLRRNLGIERQILSASHSISIGFDMVPVGRPAFEFPALTYFSERVKRARRLCDAVPDRKPDAGQPFRLPRGRRSLAARDAEEAGRDHERRAAQAAPHHRRIRRCRRRQDQARRSLCLNRLSPTRRRPGRRCLCGHLPGYRHRHRQGVHRRRPALQRPYPRLACDRGHGRGQDRFLLRRSGQAGLRRLVDGQSRQLPQGHDRERAVLACAALGALPGVVRRRRLRRMRNGISAGSNRRAHSSSSSSLSSSA